MQKQLSKEEAELHNKCYNEAIELIKGEILLHGQQITQPGFWARRKLQRAIVLFHKVLEIAPENWATMWSLGKTLQRLGENSEALNWFGKAWELQPNNADVAREAALTAMRINRADDAIKYCNEALKVEPGEAGLLGNLALALLHAGKATEALQKVQEAVQANPNDKVNVNVLRVIKHIIETKAPCPKNADELQRYCQAHREIFR